MTMGRPVRDLLGEQFTRLTVIEFAGVHGASGRTLAYWKCQCECGNVITVKGTNLTVGNTRSCGCIRRNS